jgi:hypothetical protein
MSPKDRFENDSHTIRRVEIKTLPRRLSCRTKELDRPDAALRVNHRAAFPAINATFDNCGIPSVHPAFASLNVNQ